MSRTFKDVTKGKIARIRSAQIRPVSGWDADSWNQRDQAWNEIDELVERSDRKVSGWGRDRRKMRAEALARKESKLRRQLRRDMRDVQFNDSDD